METPTLKGLLEVLEGERAVIEKQTAPLHAQRAELQAKVQPLEDEMRALAGQIKKIEQPRLTKLARDIVDVKQLLARREGKTVHKMSSGG